MQRLQRITINVAHDLIFRFAQDDIDLLFPNSFIEEAPLYVGLQCKYG